MFQNERVLLFAETELIEMKDKRVEAENVSKGKKVVLENQQKEYIQKNIIQFYVFYILKYMAHSSAYETAKSAIDNSG